MSDAALRTLDRPGVVVSFADRVHRLNAKMRAGRVTRERVELAAWCKSSVACAVLGREEPVAFPGDNWWSGLRRFGGEVCVLAAGHVLLAVKPAKDARLPFRAEGKRAFIATGIGEALVAWVNSRASHSRRNSALHDGLREVFRKHGWPDDPIGVMAQEVWSPMREPPTVQAWRRFDEWAVRRVHRLDEAAGPAVCTWAIGEAP